MTHQPALFHDSIYDALNADVAALGGVKKVAPQLWPAVSDAASRLRSCLSLGHAQKLCPEELLALKRLARSVGSNATVTFEAQQLGFEVTWLSPEDERAKAQREFTASVARLEQIARGLQR